MIDRTECYNCRHPAFAHDDEAFGCCAEERVEVPADSGVFELASCGCFNMEPTSPYNDQFWLEYRDVIKPLTDILGCTRWQASELLWKAITKDGYQYA